MEKLFEVSGGIPRRNPLTFTWRITTLIRRAWDGGQHLPLLARSKHELKLTPGSILHILSNIAALLFREKEVTGR